MWIHENHRYLEYGGLKVTVGTDRSKPPENKEVMELLEGLFGLPIGDYGNFRIDVYWYEDLRVVMATFRTEKKRKSWLTKEAQAAMSLLSKVGNVDGWRRFSAGAENMLTNIYIKRV